MNKKCCKDNGPKYVISTKDSGNYIECKPMSKEEVEDEVADMLDCGDYAESNVIVYKLTEVDFEVQNKDVEVEIID